MRGAPDLEWVCRPSWARAAAELTEPTFADGRYIALVGVHTFDNGAMTVRGPRGSVVVEGTPDEIDALARAIRLLDGSAALRPGDIPIDASAWHDLLTGLDAIGALIDLEQAWRQFHRESSNPNQIPPSHDPMDAYHLARWEPTGDILESIVTDTEQDTRESVDLTRPCDAERSCLAALELAATAYELHDGHRPVASGGALYPLHLWVVGSPSPQEQRPFVAIDHDHRQFIRCPDIDDVAFRNAFIADPGVDAALENGAAIILIGADSRRTTWKYGNRGYRYILIETGAVMHEIYRRATSSGVGVRAVAGFFDEALSSYIDRDLFVTLTVFVAASKSLS